MVTASVTEHLRRERRVLELAQAEHLRYVAVHGRRAIRVFHAKGAALHLLESDGERTVDQSAPDCVAGEEKRARAGRAVVVNVDNRDPGQPEFIDGPLTIGRVAVYVASKGLFDQVVRNMSV